MFFDLPSDKTCIHPEHDPPTGLYIPPGKGYRHVCPACKTVKDVIPPDYSLALPDPVRRTVVQRWKLVGRGVASSMNLESYLYYLVRPEHRDGLRQALDRMGV